MRARSLVLSLCPAVPAALPDRPGDAAARRALRWRLRAARMACAVLLVVAGMAGVASVYGAGGGAGGGEASRARAERERGRVVPLQQVLQQVAQALPGRLLEAELEDDDGVLVYELTWLLADGRRLDIEIDARSGQWLALEGARLEMAFRRPAVGAR